MYKSVHHKAKGIQIVLTIIAIIFSLLFIFPFSPQQNAYAEDSEYGKVYVNSTQGNDTSGTGAYDAPYKTIAKAINIANNGDRILI